MIQGKIGIEVECIVKNNKVAELRNICHTNQWNFGSDGSIRNYSYPSETGVEFTIGPYSLDDIPNMLNKLEEALKLVKVNSSCGLHFHLSFNNIAVYYKLLNWNFVSLFQQKIVSKFKSRLEQGRLNNNFCKFYTSESDFKTQTTIQLDSFCKNNRYFAVNYNSYNLHKTIEFRIFAPTNKVKKVKSYINLVLNSIKSYLKDAQFNPLVVDVPNKKPHKKSPIIIREILTKEVRQ